MKEYTIHFRDYSWTDEISKDEKDSIREIYSDEYKEESEEVSIEEVSTDKLLLRFCDEIETKVKASKARHIDLLNSKNEEVTLFKELKEGRMITQGYVGVLSTQIKDSKVTVHFLSRFDNRDSRFLMYVFEKAFGLNGKIYEELAVKGSWEKTWDFLLMILFVRQMHEAMKNGMYKQYQEFSYNDSSVKGRINIAEHIRQNPLNNGKVAYVTRDFTANNDVNRLVLKACQCLEKKYRQEFHRLLANDDICKKGIQFLKSEIDDWAAEKNHTVIKNARKKIVQSVYKNYEPLRKTSIAILRRLGVNSFSNQSGQIDGVLINMPKLWEEFIHNDIFCNVLNRKTKYSQGDGYSILEGRRTVKPDFLYLNVVFDAKYRAHWEKNIQKEHQQWDDDSREDVFQLLSYMYIFECSQGGFIFPMKENEKTYAMKSFAVGQKQAEKKVWLVPIVVPKESESDDREFRYKIDVQMQSIREQIKNEFFKSDSTP